MTASLAPPCNGPFNAPIAAEDESLTAESAALARIGLARYFAGALLLPYTLFLGAAESLRYDIDLLSLKFEVGFETICRLLTTLQRPGERGVSFFFVRTDGVGKISKRQSANAFHVSRVGDSCPLWVVHEAFANPGRILTQVSKMPDERAYLWIARTTAAVSDISPRNASSRSASAATSGTPIGWSTHAASRRTTRARSSRSARAARSATGPRARNAHSRSWAGPYSSTRTAAAISRIRRAGRRAAPVSG
ncbi:putative transcriptional regulator [Rhodococcus percolatus]|nr:putative transcriptional regulator [Rhodococcus opacus]MBP2208437.1 putative transcriptional regulator [Rhodococcus opacus]